MPLGSAQQLALVQIAGVARVEEAEDLLELCLDRSMRIPHQQHSEHTLREIIYDVIGTWDPEALSERHKCAHVATIAWLVIFATDLHVDPKRKCRGD